MSRDGYFDRDGQPLEMMEWAAKYESSEYQTVALDTLNGIDVSTVWIGLNHNFGDGPPLIFETMVFGGGLDQEQWRYATEEEALAGHAHALALVRSDQQVSP